MHKFAKIALPFWLPLCCLVLLFSNFSSPIPGAVPLLLLDSSDHLEAEFPVSVLSADYSNIIYLSKIVPETIAKVQSEKKGFNLLFQKDGKLTPQNGMYLAVSKFIVPGLSVRKLLYPFHSFL